VAGLQPRRSWDHASQTLNKIGDLFRKILSVRRSKNESSHRVIPLNVSALKALSRMVERADAVGHTEPEHYLWPACRWEKLDPSKPIQQWDTAWRALRAQANLPGLRFHDLRHTVITELAEMGVPDAVLESISGHLSKRMLDHYSHIRLDAKRKALDGLEEAREQQAAAEADAGAQHEQQKETVQ
jgi:integrase